MASPQNHPPAPQNNPASAPTATSLTWRYPFSAKDGKEITDPQIFYGALGAMSDGFFPLGVNGFPHGGVHFGPASGSRVDQSKGVRVIANGDIVAYKLDDTYPHLQFTQTRHWALYSTGFVLVRHKMTMPPAPGSSAPQPEDETLTFFSLYMHMADWSTYLADDKLDRPGWWLGVDAFRIKAKDTQIGGGASGAFVLTAPMHGKKKGQYVQGEPVGFLPEGSEVTISETRGSWGHIKEVTSGAMIAATGGAVFGSDDLNNPWTRPDDDVASPNAGENSHVPSAPKTVPLTPEGDWGWIKLQDQRSLKEPTGVGTVITPPKDHPIHVDAGALLGQLGEYIDYETSTPLPPVPSRQLLHLEVFADETLKAFIEKSRSRVANLPPNDSGRTIFVIQAGAKLVAKPIDPDLKLGDGVRLAKLTLTPASPKSCPWVQVQPWISGPSGQAQQYQGAVWIARSNLSRLDSPNGLPAWKSFPLQLSQASSPVNSDLVTYPRAELNSLGDGNVAVDDKGVSWWRLEVATGSGQAATGWVCGGKQSDGSGNQPGTRWESPWAWPGFEIVDATGINLTDAFKRNLSVTGSANPKEQKAFAPSTAAVGNSALLSKLEQTVSRLPSPNGTKDQQGKDGSAVVTAVKLRQALGRRWLASDLGHVILKYESEWGGGTSRWEALTPLMRNAAENWKCELERIKKLQWWDSVKGKVEEFPASPVVNHIHPMALIGNFSQGTCSCNKDITEEELDLLLPSDVKLKGLFHAAHDASVHGFDKNKFLDMLNKYMRENDMMTCVRKAHFLSQMSHECDGLRTNEEYRNKDGSIPSGWNNYHGGSNFHGRGLIQLTHDTNYTAYGNFVGDTTIGTNPDKVSHSIDHTTHSGCWYWRHGSHWGDINPKADRNDFYAITVAVNGGFTHVDDRFVALNKLAKMLGAEKCATNPGLKFNDYQMEKSSLYDSDFYNKNPKRIKEAVEAVDAKKSKI
ncbi:glycoside hydrolase family 19 protein [Paraburkholderia phenazinium]|uniref:Predicted chitinase n=1 Tax=Paraburkholderia phenazinium TaxID=60549 RepID=A0A1N6GDL5_9BURK|nr:lytic transglycosylase domain-containing protein [Paraburkholderia phenazinium]SIO05628.1 Predicted chitinase [Paraburkholderia phenazinium]